MRFREPALPSEANTLVAVLRERAVTQGERRALTFLLDGDDEESAVTYAEIDRQARAIAALLQEQQAAGERALLVYPPGLDYVAAFLGCLYAGVTAVPVYPPRASRPDPRFEAIAQDSTASVALTTRETLAALQSRGALSQTLPSMRWLTSDDIEPGLASAWSDPKLTPGTLAFLQYTSGSTASPKGVAVSHGNLVHNATQMAQAIFKQEPEVFVSWLPLYHDMGLIGGLILPLHAGFESVLMSPLAFLQRPFRWLRAVSRFRGTISPAPNFAYDLCARKVTPEQIATLDLSSWGTAVNGAEPVQAATMDRFVERFSVCGFKRSALHPSYGLAEGTLYVSGIVSPAGPDVTLLSRTALEQNRVEAASPSDPNAQPFVSCGLQPAEVHVRIVEPETRAPVAADRVGEIWISGASVAQGYWNRPDATEQSFRAYLDSGEGPFFRTGDLGFLKEEQLYVTGRLKDLIIIRGQNHYPQDLEWTTQESHAAIRRDCCAAFSVEADGEEKLVIAAEVERQWRKGNLAEVALAVQTAVTERHALKLHAVVLLLPGGIPKTSSGKIRRSAAKAGFLDESLGAVFVMINNRPMPGWGKADSAESLPEELS